MAVGRHGARSLALELGHRILPCCGQVVLVAKQLQGLSRHCIVSRATPASPSIPGDR